MFYFILALMSCARWSILLLRGSLRTLLVIEYVLLGVQVIIAGFMAGGKEENQVMVFFVFLFLFESFKFRKVVMKRIARLTLS